MQKVSAQCSAAVSPGQTLRGLPPLAARGARVLILGSFPSEASLRARKYYAHPRNQFWKIAEQLFAIAHAQSYAQRCKKLCACGIAVWDVIASCRRRGSLDGNIRDAVANDFAAFFRAHAKIESVFCNGGAAYAHYKKFAQGDMCNFPAAVRLPSTSPAHAAVSLAQKVEAWRVVRDALRESR